MKTIGSKANLMVLVSLATLMMTSAGSAQGFGIGTTQNQTGIGGQGTSPVLVVTSRSMIPSLNVGDVVTVSHDVPFNDLKVGDIIAFRTFGTTDTGQHEIIIHRVAQIVTDNSSQRIIRAKGDANNDSIPSLDYPIFQQNYIGKVIYVVPSGTNGGVGNTVPNNGSGNTGTNWMDLCTKVSFALTSSCDTLVNPDNTLTSQGMHVRDCIQGGALLAAGALLIGVDADID